MLAGPPPVTLWVRLLAIFWATSSSLRWTALSSVTCSEAQLVTQAVFPWRYAHRFLSHDSISLCLLSSEVKQGLVLGMLLLQLVNNK